MTDKLLKLSKILSITYCLVFTVTVQSHHSVGELYDLSNTVEWEGVITEMDWINPHSYVYLEVTEDDGTINTWRFETLPTATFSKSGLNKEMVMGDGQSVKISGFSARQGSRNSGYIVRIDYENGYFYQLSSAPNL